MSCVLLDFCVGANLSVCSLKLLPGTGWELVWGGNHCPFPLPLPNLARAGGALLLLGVGTLICYRLASRRRRSSASLRRRRPSSPSTNSNNKRGSDTGDCPPSGGSEDGWRQVLLLRWREWWQARRCNRVLAEYSDPLREDSENFEARYFGPVDSPLSPSSSAWTAPSRGRRRKRNLVGAEPVLSSLQFFRGAALQSRPHSVNSGSRDSTPYQADCSASFSTDEQQSLSECDVCATSPCCCSPIVTTSSSTLMGNKCDRHYDTALYNRDSTDVVFTRLVDPSLHPPNAAGVLSQSSARVVLVESICPEERLSSSPREERHCRGPSGDDDGGVGYLSRPHTRNSLPPLPPGGSTADSSSCTPPQSSASRRRLQRRLSGVARSGGSLCLSVGELSQLCQHPTPPPSLPPMDVFSGGESDDAWLDADGDADDVCWPDTVGVNTAELLEQLQQQLDLLKNDVSCLDTELVTLHFPHCPLEGSASSGAKWKLASIGRSQSEYKVHETMAGTPGVCEPPYAALAVQPPPCVSSTGLSDCNITDASLEWDSPSHGWAPLSRAGAGPSGPRVAPGARQMVLARSVSLQNASLPAGVSVGQTECDLPSLEWDNSGIVQYTDIVDEEEEDGERLESALELDMECELLTASVMTSERVEVTSRGHHVTSTPCRPSSLVLADVGCVSGLDTSGYEGTDPDTRNTSGAQSETTPPSQSHLDSGAISSCDSTNPPAPFDSTSTSTPVPLRRPAGSEPVPRAQRDSAYWDDGLDTEAARATLRPAVSQPVNLLEYGEQQWAGNTSRAATVRAGYSAAARDLQLSSLQLVRGDNYCAVRAALYQLVAGSRGGPPFLCDGDTVTRCLRTLDEVDGLERWTFGSRLSFPSVREGAVQCLESIAELMAELDVCECDCSAWRTRLCSVWNNSPDRDTRLMEAVKLHMLSTASRLYQQLQNSQCVPEFVGLLFARDTSCDPLSLMTNHLNQVGDTGGLEQVDMCLLAETLGVSLRVVRPSAHGQTDFVSYFPPRQQQHKEESLVLTLIAEDDRHYNIAYSS